MDISEALFNRPIAGAEIEHLSKLFSEQNGAAINIEDEQRKKIARDFESIFIHQILDKMKDTIPKSDLADSSSEQIQSMYWSFMAETIADKGGFGLWKQIYANMPGGKSDGSQSDVSKDAQNVESVQRLDERV